MRCFIFIFSLLCYHTHFYATEVVDNSHVDHHYETIEDKNTLKILTPALSNREIAKIRLDNGLEAYLVSDPGADESAAALAVHVGSWSDPKEFPGMAHFLEHMLFMGTQTYPDENAFSQYITDHGGHSNAYTSLDRTVYMFSVNNDAFTKALDLFSHFFIDPLFKASEVGRELHAVDQEHAKNIQNDSRRKWMIFKETGNQNHPNKAFATGNATTLGHIPREALVNWYSQYYSASCMHLVLYSPLPIETLKELATKDFSNVKQLKSETAVAYAPLSSSLQQGHITYIKPVKDLRILSLDWELPKHIAEDKETHSADLIAFVLANGGDNSLIEELKKEKLAESLTASVERLSSDHVFLHMNVLLTKQGVSQRFNVIERCFQTIALLKRNGVPSFLFNEMQTMAKINYEYQSREKAFDFVSDTADALIDESLDTFPQKTLEPLNYNPKTITAILDLLTPQNCLYCVIAPPELTGVTPDKKEPWNGGEYAIRPIPENTLKQWASLTPHKLIALPTPNPYMQKNLSLLHQSKSFSNPPTPLLLNHQDDGISYLWEDTYYHTPNIVYLLGIKTPSLDGSAKSRVLTDLLIKTFSQKCAPTLSVANTAGLYANLELKNLRLVLTVHGYSEKAPAFLKHLLFSIKHLSCSKEEFAIYKDSLASLYENQRKAEPYIQAGEFLSNILYNDAPLSTQKFSSLKNLSYEDFTSFLTKCFTECYVEGLYTGNLTKQDADLLVQDVKHTLSYRPYPLAQQHQKEVFILPKNLGPYAVTEKIQVFGNAVLLVIEQGSFSFEKKAAQLMLATILSDSFYNTLRSQQQTGYITASWPREVQQQLLQFFLVQSSTHEVQDLLARFEVFLESYVKDFPGQLANDRFEDIKKNCIETLSQIPTNLEEMTSQLYELGFERKGNFSFTQELIAAIQALSYDQLKKETTSFLSRRNSQRIALLAEGDLQEHFLYKPISSEALKQQGSYVVYR